MRQYALSQFDYAAHLQLTHYRRIFLPLALLLALVFTVLAYLPGLHGPFVFDDITNIVQNGALKIPNLHWDQLMHAAFSSDAGPTRRPLSSLSFALNYYFGGTGSFSFKLTNVVIHLINGLLFFLLLRQIVRYWRNTDAIKSDVTAKWLPLLGAAAWLLHPLNLTAVLYVVQRETSLCSLFILIGCVCYCHGRLRLLKGRSGWWWIFIGAAASAVLALAAKETAALLPIYLLVIEFCVFRFALAEPERNRLREFMRQRGLLIFYLLFLVLPFALGMFWLFAIHHGSAFSYSGRDYTLGERLLTEPRVVWDYIRWTLYPRLPDLGLYHDDIPLSEGMLSPPTTLLSILGLIALLVLAGFTWKKRPWICFGILWFFTGQLLESTVFPLEIAFEHRNYLADMGIILAVTTFILTEPTRYVKVLVRFAVIVLVVLTFGALTGMRSYIWRSTNSLVAVQAANHPRSPYATYALGEQLTNEVLGGKRVLLPEAVQALRRSSELPNSGIIAGAALALLEAQMLDNNDPANFANMAQRLRTRPISASDQQGLVALVQCQNADNCHFTRAELESLFTSALANLRIGKGSTYANILTDYGNFLGQGGHSDLVKSRELMLKAAEAVPSEPQYRMNVVVLDIALEDKALAEKDLQKVEALNRIGNLTPAIRNLQQRIDAIKPAPPATTANPAAPAAATQR